MGVQFASKGASLVSRFAAALLALIVGFVLAVPSLSAWADEPEAVPISVEPPTESVVVLDEEKNAVNENQLPDTSFIYDSTIEELASADSYYDKQTVQVVGEATGDIVSVDFDDNNCWVMLWEQSATHRGESNTLTVFMSKEDAELIDTLGSYSRKGTTLQVRGIYNLVCSEHNGVSDLHASHVAVTKRGSTVDHPFEIGMFLPGLFLLAVGGGLFYLFNRIRERQR